MKLPVSPLTVGAMAICHYSLDLETACTFTSKFDGPICLAERFVNPDMELMLRVPRALVRPPEPERDFRVQGVPMSVTMKNPPRNDTQRAIIKTSVDLLAKDFSHVLQATTGFGKTYCGLNIASQLGRATLIVVTKEDLLEQWKTAILTHTNVPASRIGIVQQDVCEYKDRDFVIAMVHSLVKDKYPADLKEHFGLVIFDEVHRMAADTFQKSCGMFPAKLRLGLSATPKRIDGKQFVFEAHIGPVMSSTSLLQIPPKVICQKTKFTLPMVTRRLPQGLRKVPLPHTPGKMMAVYKAMADNEPRNKMIVEFVYRAYAKERTIIVFSDLKEAHLERLYWMAVAGGIPKEDMAYYVGGMSDKAREEAKKKRVLWATYAMTAEATDIPWLDTAVLATPRANIVQTVGRILREWPDKKEPVVYDLIDGCSSVLLAFASRRRTDYYKMGAKVLNI